MTWQYRVMRHTASNGEFYYDIREVYYREDAPEVPGPEWVEGWTAEAVTPWGLDAEELLASLARMINAHNKPVLIEEQLPGYEPEPEPDTSPVTREELLGLDEDVRDWIMEEDDDEEDLPDD